jgi:hypothetical protein
MRKFLVIALLLVSTVVAFGQEEVCVPVPTPYAGKQVDVLLYNEGMYFVGTLVYPSNVDKPCPGVLLLPGFMGERDELPVVDTSMPAEGGRPQGMFERLALKLAEAGYVSLRIDYRHSGKSEGYWEDATVTGELSDAIVALSYLARNPAVDASRLAVCGLSLGGALASCMSNVPLVKVVVLWSAAPQMDILEVMVPPEQQVELEERGIVTFTLPWGETTTLKKTFFDSIQELDPLGEIAAFPGPLLAICGSRDELVAPQPEQTLKFLEAHDGEEMLVMLDADHTFDNFFGSTKLDQAIHKTIDWLDKFLK